MRILQRSTWVDRLWRCEYGPMGGANESMIGKHFLVHVGYAIAEISEEESEETMRLLKQIAGLDDSDTFETEST